MTLEVTSPPSHKEQGYSSKPQRLAMALSNSALVVLPGDEAFLLQVLTAHLDTMPWHTLRCGPQITQKSVTHVPARQPSPGVQAAWETPLFNAALASITARGGSWRSLSSLIWLLAA